MSTNPTKNRKWLYVIITVIVVAVIVTSIVLYRKAKAKKAIDNAMKPDAPTPENAPAFNPGSGNRPTRNNNPFNLRLTSLAWTGKVPKAQNTDGAFEQFYEKKYGVRAGIKNIITQVVKKGHNTLDSLIKVYAPSNENDTTAYINQMSQWTAMMPMVPFEATKDVILKIAGAIARKEGSPLSDDELNEAYNLI